MAQNKIFFILKYFFIVFFISNYSYSQTFPKLITGFIQNYSQQPLYLYKCYGDTLLFIDSTFTNKKGGFSFYYETVQTVMGYVFNFSDNNSSPIGLYKIVLNQNQSFQFLVDTQDVVQIQTTYKPDFFYNIATDSLIVIKSEENKRFYKFIHLQNQVNIANYFLLNMMRIYPLPDLFHKEIELEYIKRHNAFRQFVIYLIDNFPDNISTKIAKAYFLPVLPDWKQPDSWRDSIFVNHFFDYFNPSNIFYIHTNILPEKIDFYLMLRTNKKNAFGQPVYSEDSLYVAAEEFLLHIKNSQSSSNDINFKFALSYILKGFLYERKYLAFMKLYDKYLNIEGEACEIEDDNVKFFIEEAGKIKNIQIGNKAPNFTLGINSDLNLHQIGNDYILLIFWASWCNHCHDELFQINNLIDKYLPIFNKLSKQLFIISVSLDTQEDKWRNFLTQNNLSKWFNISNFMGWNCKIAKAYHIYATPTFFLLDKNKNIILKPSNWQELENYFIQNGFDIH